jgi:hypothetical protein
MPFFPVDDGLWGHPKADAAGDAALGLWTRAGSYCAKYTTEGTMTAARSGSSARSRRRSGPS